jgi:Heparinase II/III-like protein/Heparinase II/III N-terminus
VTLSLGRLVRTISHLRPSQVAWRIVHVGRLRRNAASRPRYAWLDGAARFAVAGQRPGHESHELKRVAEMWRAGKVEYLALAGDRLDWLGVGRPKLWRYERQYHAEVVALAADPAGFDDAQELVSSWIAACPQPRGDAWEPYPVARRILNWSLAGYVSPELGASIAAGLAAQVRFLSHHLERHLLGNHLICDAAALVAGSAAVEAAGLAETGTLGARLLAQELERQVLPDGGYAERTAQYHAIVLRDVLLALALTRARGLALDQRVENAARAMSRWLAGVAREDAVPYLNDAAPGATPAVREVLSLARALRLIDGPWDSWLGRAFGLSAPGRPPEPREDLRLPDTGWTFVREGKHELLFEHGPIGPAEQPGHGHSDALSYELLWNGHAVVVDTGITTYDVGPIRDFERSAPAHATVSVAGAGPDELWAAFRVGARAKVESKIFRRTVEGVRILEGRVRAPAGWEHRRQLVYWPGVALAVFDRVVGARGMVRSHLPLSPGCTLVADGTLRFAGGSLQLARLRGTLDAGTESWVGEGFGKRRPRKSFAFRADDQGRVAYAIIAPGRSVEITGSSCVLHGPEGAVQVSLVE